MNPDRIDAIKTLDRVWPAARGVPVSEAKAREAMMRSAPADTSLEYDHARQQAMLSSLVWSQLLIRGPLDERTMQPTYTRPLSDELPAKPDKPAAVMFHPMDGGDPVPYADHIVAMAEKAAQPVAPVVVDDLPEWAELAGTELRINLGKLHADVATVTLTPRAHRKIEVSSGTN